MVKTTKQRQIDRLIRTRYKDYFVTGYSVCKIRCWFCFVDLFFFLFEVPHGSSRSIEHGLSFSYGAFQNNKAP